MPDIATPDTADRRKIHWSRALIAGLIATIVMTIVMVLGGMNMIKMLGSMLAGANAGTGTQYAAGGAMHLMIGIVYGILYAAIFGWVIEWNRFVKGAVYGLAIAAIAFAVMPVMSAMMSGGTGASSHNNASAMNACHAQSGAANPCQMKKAANANPCHAGEKPMNACHSKAAGNPCNPCGGSSGPWSGVMSVVNHLVYALTLAFVYGKFR